MTFCMFNTVLMYKMYFPRAFKNYAKNTAAYTSLLSKNAIAIILKNGTYVTLEL